MTLQNSRFRRGMLLRGARVGSSRKSVTIVAEVNRFMGLYPHVCLSWTDLESEFHVIVRQTGTKYEILRTHTSGSSLCVAPETAMEISASLP
jgi:hypothetical protein